jgi:hypothetical protein
VATSLEGPDAVRLRVVRLAVACVGLAVAVYSLASLTGGWLGKPPWWWRDPADLSEHEEDELIMSTAPEAERHNDVVLRREGRERISAILVAVGGAAAVVGLASAWPRRSKAEPPTTM